MDKDPLRDLLADDDVDTFALSTNAKKVSNEDTASLLKEADLLASKVQHKDLFSNSSTKHKKSSLFGDDDDEDIENSMTSEIAKFKLSREQNLTAQTSSKAAASPSTSASDADHVKEPSVKPAPVPQPKPKSSLFDDEDDNTQVDDDIFGGATAKYRTNTTNTKKDVYIPPQAVEMRAEEEKVKVKKEVGEVALIDSIGNDDLDALMSSIKSDTAHPTTTTKEAVKPQSKVKFDASLFSGSGNVDLGLSDDLFSGFDVSSTGAKKPTTASSNIGDDFDFGAYINQESGKKASGLFD